MAEDNSAQWNNQMMGWVPPLPPMPPTTTMPPVTSLPPQLMSALPPPPPPVSTMPPSLVTSLPPSLVTAPPPPPPPVSAMPPVSTMTPGPAVPPPTVSSMPPMPPSMPSIPPPSMSLSMPLNNVGPTYTSGGYSSWMEPPPQPHTTTHTAQHPQPPQCDVWQDSTGNQAMMGEAARHDSGGNTHAQQQSMDWSSNYNENLHQHPDSTIQQYNESANQGQENIHQQQYPDSTVQQYSGSVDQNASYYRNQQGDGYGTQQGDGYGTQQGDGYGTQQGNGYGTQQGSGYTTQQGNGYVTQGNGYATQQGNGYGIQQGSGYGAQQGNGYITQQGNGYRTQQGDGNINQQVDGYTTQQGDGNTNQQVDGYTTQQNYGNVNQQVDGNINQEAGDKNNENIGDQFIRMYDTKPQDYSIDEDKHHMYNKNEEWFRLENEWLCAQYGEDIVIAAPMKAMTGKLGYSCRLCYAVLNSRALTARHCSGHKHLERVELWNKFKGKGTDDKGNEAALTNDGQAKAQPDAGVEQQVCTWDQRDKVPPPRPDNEPKSEFLPDLPDYTDEQLMELYDKEKERLDSLYGDATVRLAYSEKFRGLFDYHCQVCLVVLKSPKNLTIHCNGNKHMRKYNMQMKIKDSEILQDNQGMTRILMEAIARGALNKQHVSSNNQQKRHHEQETETSTENESVAEVVVNTKEEATSSGIQQEVEAVSEAKNEDDKVSGQDPAKPAAEVHTRRVRLWTDDKDESWYNAENECLDAEFGTGVISVTMGEIGYKCQPCKVMMNSRKTLKDHCIGTRHIRTAKELGLDRVASSVNEGKRKAETETVETENVEPKPKKTKAKTTWKPDISNLSDMRDRKWLTAVSEKLGQEYGEGVIVLVPSKHLKDRYHYFCQICESVLVARKDLEAHCNGMKHLKKKNAKDKQKVESGDDEHENKDEGDTSETGGHRSPLPDFLDAPGMDRENQKQGNEEKKQEVDHQQVILQQKLILIQQRQILENQQKQRQRQQDNYRSMSKQLSEGEREWDNVEDPQYQQHQQDLYQRPNKRTFHQPPSRPPHKHNQERQDEEYQQLLNQRIHQHKQKEKQTQEKTPPQPLSRSKIGQALKKLANHTVKCDADAELATEVIIMLVKLLKDDNEAQMFSNKVAQMLSQATGTMISLRAFHNLMDQ